jgi:type VI protein secretion system component VasK
MTDTRSALNVEAVLDRFTVTEQLLAQATQKVLTLGDAATTATASSATIAEAAQGITAASAQLAQMIEEMTAAHRALVDAMGVARQFLEGTDVSAVATNLKALDTRLAVVEESQTSVQEQLVQDADDLSQQLRALTAAVDRTRAVELERDTAKQQLAAVLAKLPDRAVKKLGLTS